MAVVKALTKHTFSFLLRLRQVLLGQFQIELELNVFVLQLSITSRKVAGFLRRTNQKMSKTIHFRVTKEKS